MPFFKINENDNRIYASKTRTSIEIVSNSSGISGGQKILSTPGFLENGDIAIEEGNRGALERIPGSQFFDQSYTVESGIYPGGVFNALNPYDEVRQLEILNIQSGTYISTDLTQSMYGQIRDSLQNVYMPSYASHYGARYDNSVLNKHTLALARPILTPSYPFSQNNSYSFVNTGFTALSYVKVMQDDIGSDDVFEITSSGFASVSPPADIIVSEGLSPILTVLSASWSGFASGSSATNLNTLTGLQVPFVCFSYGINRDSNGDRRIYVLAATGSGQTNIFQAQSEPLDIELDQWNQVGVRWQENINARTGSFILNGVNVGDFVLNVSSITFPSNSGNWIDSSYDFPLVSSSFTEIGNISTSVDGLITLGNLGQFRLSGSHPTGFDYPKQLGSCKLIELHDISLHSRFLELDEIENNTNKSYEEDLDCVFYVPVMAPRTRVIDSGVADLFTQSNFTNSLGYYGNNYFDSIRVGSKVLYLEEPHILSVAQLGANINTTTYVSSPVDILQLGGDVANTIWSNASFGDNQGVHWNNTKSPLLGFGTQWMQNLSLVDVSNGNFAVPVFIASGTIEGQSRRTFIPSNPMDLISDLTSGSYAPSTIRIWPSDHHEFTVDASILNNWLSNSIKSSSYLEQFYSDFEFRNRFDAGKSKNIIDIFYGYVQFYNNDDVNPFVVPIQTGLFADCDHFTNTSYNGSSVFYLPKIIMGDKMQKGSYYFETQPKMIATNSVSFGDIYSTHNNITLVDSFMIRFQDNQYGGLIRSNNVLTDKENQLTYHNIGSIFYDRGIVYFTHPSLLWIGNEDGSFEDVDQFNITFISENNAYIKESEYTIPKNNARYLATDLNGEIDVFNGIDIFDVNGNVLEKVRIMQPVQRLSGSAVTVRTFTVF
jgi:hypothetical protein